MLVASLDMTTPRPERGSRAASPGSSVVYFIFVCLGVLPVLAMPVFRNASVGSGAEYSCLSGYVPPDAVPYGPLRAWETTFPAGRYCEWQGMSGGITTYQTGWIPTVVACFATLLVVWMTVLAIRERRPQKVFVALIPALLTLLSWALVLV